MDLEKYAYHLGGLVANLQSLEFALRASLSNSSGVSQTEEVQAEFYSYAVGTTLPLNLFTNYDTLGMLIKKANNLLQEHNAPLLDEGLVEIRDALAHGRIASLKDEERLRLIKYSRPINGQVQVTFNEVLDEHWFMVNKRRVRDAINILRPFFQS